MPRSLKKQIKVETQAQLDTACWERIAKFVGLREYWKVACVAPIDAKRVRRALIKKNTKIKRSGDTIRYEIDGVLHREDGPAVESANGYKAWYWNGKLDRKDGPAVEWSNGRKDWRRNGKFHREDGPAVEYSNGARAWYRNGKLHREDGPAVEYSDGARAWYRNGKLHREDGPAVEYSDGSREWWRNGIRYQ